MTGSKVTAILMTKSAVLHLYLLIIFFYNIKRTFFFTPCQAQIFMVLQAMHKSSNCTNIPPHPTTLTLLHQTYQHQTTLQLNAAHFLSPHYTVNHTLYTLKPGTPQTPQLKPWEFTATCGVLVNVGHTQLHNMSTLCTHCTAQQEKLLTTLCAVKYRTLTYFS